LHPILSVIGVGVFLSVSMAGAWWMQRVTGNTGWIDVFWSLGTGAAACALALAPHGADPWPQDRQVLAAVFVATWSLRLGWHILSRTRRVGDEPRYRDLIRRWGAQGAWKLFWHLQIQAAVGLLLAVSVLLAARNPAPLFRFQDTAALVLFLIGAVGEAVADVQLRRFKSLEANRSKVCDSGLWRWSRHPNYFFEWLCWLSYPLLAIGEGNSLGYLSLSAPLCMYWLLVHVSGIPPLEAHMTSTRARAFVDYRRRTQAFFPWPPSSNE
jgi:steroid 5-alpha reductase family enzyme